MVLRWVIIVIGAKLIENNVIDQPTLDSITTPGALLALAGLIALGATSVFGYWRAKYAVALPEAALRADPGTSLETVKADVKSKL